MAKIGVLFFGRKRPGFDLVWGKHIETLAKNELNKLEHEVVVFGNPIVDDLSLQQAITEFRSAGVDVPVILQAAMSDGRLATRIGQLWTDPVVLWATPENPDSLKVSSCSLVGTHVFAANLRQLHRPFELAYGMPDDPSTARELDVACRVAYAFKKLHAARIGLIGYQAPGFIDMTCDPFALSAQIGPELYHASVQEFVDRMNAVDADEAEGDTTAVAMNLPMDDIAQEDLLSASRFCLAVKALVREECLDALAIREWPELPNLTGHWPYLAIARLLEENVPIACEGDVDGAVLSLIGCLLGLEPGFLTDWLEHDDTTITLWHGGCAPLGLCEPTARIGRHFNGDKPAVINARLAPGNEVTLCRLWRCDDTYRMMIEEATTIQPKRDLLGTIGAVEIAGRNVRIWFDKLCHAGMPHHVVIFPGKQAGVLKRLARLLDISLFNVHS